MESLEDSNGLGQSMNDSFSLYERYMRSFNIGDSRVENIREPPHHLSPRHFHCSYSNSHDNIDLPVAQSDILEHNLPESECNLLNQNTCDNIADKLSDSEYHRAEGDYQSSSPAAESCDNSNTAENSRLTDKSYQTGSLLVSSEETNQGSFRPPLFLTSTMENSNNAVDSVPLFCDVRNGENVFKLPNIELTFNGTIKHVQKLNPIVDPVSVLTSQNLAKLQSKSEDQPFEQTDNSLSNAPIIEKSDYSSDQKTSETEEKSIDGEILEKTSESTGESQYGEINLKKEYPVNDDESSAKWNLDNSHSSYEASFDSGVRSPDMFSDNEGDDDEINEEPEPYWSFLKDYETFDKRRVRKLEENMQGILPPPSVTIIKTDVTEMLKKYYKFLPLFNETETSKLNVSEEANSTTPTKRVAFIEIPDLTSEETSRNAEDVTLKPGDSRPSSAASKYSINQEALESKNNSDLDTSIADKTIDLKTCTEIEAVETPWPELLKCRHPDVYYNVTKYSEKFELLTLRLGERYVGAETDSSVNIHSGGFQSPSSANKRKALRLKLAQAKSPGRRLSHLARRRQAFCSAATINEKAQASNSKMVLIDKNFFPHRKLINSTERKSPRVRRTPGKKTPTRKTPGKKTPGKTPKTRSGGSSKKKAMRRLLMDDVSRSQPSRETLKRALFISPDNRKPVPAAPSTSVPTSTMRTKRALFGSPDRADTKSADGTQSDHFLKRKLDSLDDIPETNRSKIAKSLSFGGGTIGASQSISFSRRASEMFTSKSAGLNENHKQKLLWAVSEALRVHGWRMSSPGFREKASSLARLTRRLLTLPPYAARMNSANLSTSDTLLKMARKYVFAIIQGRTVEDCFEEEQTKLANNAANSKVTGYITANAYQQLKARQLTTTSFNPIKENTFNLSLKQEPKSTSKNVLQDKLVNIDSNSSSSGVSMFDRASLGIFKSNSMPSFEEAAKMRARRQISFDNVDFPKR